MTDSLLFLHTSCLEMLCASIFRVSGLQLISRQCAFSQGVYYYKRIRYASSMLTFPFLSLARCRAQGRQCKYRTTRVQHEEASNPVFCDTHTSPCSPRLFRTCPHRPPLYNARSAVLQSQGPKGASYCSGNTTGTNDISHAPLAHATKLVRLLSNSQRSVLA